MCLPSIMFFCNALPNGCSAALAASLVAGLPLSWTVVARNEYRHHTLQKMLGSKMAAAYALAGGIFLVSLWRDAAFIKAMEHNPIPIIPDEDTAEETSTTAAETTKEGPSSRPPKSAKKCCGGRCLSAVRNQIVRALGGPKKVIKGMRMMSYVIMAVSTTLVLASSAKLGITGTYLGDYCGVLMEKRVTGFPFNVLDNPMYTGGTGNFLGLALRANNAVGVALTLLASAVYVFISKLEGPFTAMIYANR